MKEKTEQKVRAIKAGKFGVEVEMYGIGRREAVETLERMFETRGTIRSTGHLSGLQVKDRKDRWWTFCSDSSIRASSLDSCELVTPILGYDDIELLQNVIRELRRHGARSNASHDCGIHIHIDASQHNPDTLRALSNLVYAHENLLLKALNVDHRRAEWCKPMDVRFLEELNIRKPKTMDDIQRIWYRSQGYSTGAVCDHYNGSRYHLMNFHSLWNGTGIEFRCFQFSESGGIGMHAGELKAYIQFALALNAMAVSAPFAKHKIHQIQNDNPKYAMASFLSRLGLRGEEFDTARKVLTRKLSGTSRPRRSRQTESAGLNLRITPASHEGFVDNSDDEVITSDELFDDTDVCVSESELAGAIADRERRMSRELA